MAITSVALYISCTNIITYKKQNDPFSYKSMHVIRILMYNTDD